MTSQTVPIRLRWPMLALIAAGVVAGIAIGLSIAQPANVEGKAKSTAGDALSNDQVVIAREPAASPHTAGFDSERLWSGYNDWEPAVAADPSSTYVYQLTTRYDGPAPCNRCRLRPPFWMWVVAEAK